MGLYENVIKEIHKKGFRAVPFGNPRLGNYGVSWYMPVNYNSGEVLRMLTKITFDYGSGALVTIATNLKVSELDYGKDERILDVVNKINKDLEYAKIYFEDRHLINEYDLIMMDANNNVDFYAKHIIKVVDALIFTARVTQKVFVKLGLNSLEGCK